ncbi:GNAT family N-acetyltransferase [Streptomyces sp. NPDC048717]|uniref:GNAT family N-acetyltransferase n=1 Tax=Streptomyces sp. NPDC048717 TaxID=3154928 RepID=UPI003432EA46
MPTIRHARPSDAAAIAGVHVRSWRAAYRDLLPAPYLDSLDPVARAVAWHERLSDPGGPVVLVAEGEAGAVEAFVSFRARHGGAAPDAVTAELSALYAVPEAWGRGIGRALLAAAVAAMRAAGFRTAGLWVFEDNARARAFYEAAGWRPDGEAVTEETGGRELRELSYRLSIS